ncbi:MAG: hypothetical protein QXI12_04355 [Candidatus Methanomethyliaceae archaeon]
MSSEKVSISVKLRPEIRDLAVQVAKAKGMDLSEYIRVLIVDDLDRRGLIKINIK